MVSNLTLWNDRPGFLAATNTNAAPGDPMRYDEPRPFPVTDPSDRTSYHPGQRTWGIDNLPDILYQIYPDQEWYRFSNSGLPYPKLDRYGRVVQESWPVDPTKPRVLLNFTILPDQIGTKECYIFFEIWRRWDPRIRWIDITMRMNRNRPTENSLNSALQRLRLSYTILSWQQMWRNVEDNANRDKVIALLPMCTIEANSSRGHTPGLIIPRMGEDGGRIAHPYVKPHVRLRVRTHTLGDIMPRIEPSKPQLRYAAPEPNMQVAQPVARLHNYDPSYENLFDWDKDASDPTENRNYGNIHTTAGFNTYNPTAQLSSGMLSREHDIERSHDNEHMYDRSNYRDIGLDNDHNKFGEMNFQTRYDTENAEDDLEPETPGHGLDLSGHDAHSPSFCWDHCFSIPLNSLPAPSASFAEEEAPEGA